MPVVWPTILKPRDFGVYPMDAETSGGSATLGEQYVVSAGGRWGASMTLDIRNDVQVFAIRALRSKLKGRATSLALPNFDGRRLSWPLDPLTGKVRHPGNTREKPLDGTPYEYPAIPTESEILATVAADAALRSVSLDIEITQGEAPKPGQQFGHLSRLYEIGDVTDLGDDTYRLTFDPPLRSAAATGALIKFTRPVLMVRCMNLNDELKKLDLHRFATLNLEFVEMPPPDSPWADFGSLPDNTQLVPLLF